MRILLGLVFAVSCFCGGVIVEESSLPSEITVEEHARTVDDYLFFTRCIDTFLVRNSGKAVIKGVFLPRKGLTYLSYYDDLGTVHKKVSLKEGHVLGFRYPLSQGLRIAFSVETVSLKTMRIPWESRKPALEGVWPFEGASPLRRTEERTLFYAWR
ncbi:uncharacterized protein NEMAJ01_2352 [Nematocida major]|uniref:uncharacterized protein n=1 Tax=Nematocida major TaxID=1912982 RepID=UPI002008C4CA|nr:uncharacterized protein NEMAJ01_2352 [Nematocida major]KAH9387456.1 hypothetical protein NEMAJ01_2352 [Nematocida major]